MGKEKPATGQPAAAEAHAAPTGLLARLLPTTRRKAIILGGVTAAIIGTAAALTLVFWPSEHVTSAQKLAQAISELEKGNHRTARQLAARVLSESDGNYTEHGGAYFILGALTLQDASEQTNAEKRQMLDMAASRGAAEPPEKGRER